MDKGAKKLSTPAGFEPARANTTAVTHDPARIAGRRLNHSAKVSLLGRLDYRLIYTKLYIALDMALVDLTYDGEILRSHSCGQSRARDATCYIVL